MSKPKYPSEQLDQYMLRLPDGMRDRIKSAAMSNGRSMNAEIVATLEEAYPAPKERRGVFDVIEELRARMEEAEDPDAYEVAKQRLHDLVDSMKKRPPKK